MMTAFRQDKFYSRTVKMAELFPNWSQGFTDDNDYEVGDVGHPAFAGEALIPTLDPNYSFPEDTALEVLTVLEKPVRNNLWVFGPTQSGKTTLIKNLAAVLKRPLFEINCDVHKLPWHLFGKTRAKPGQTYFERGIVPKWLRTPGAWLLVNEYDTADADVVNALKPVLEFPRHVCLTENNDEVVTGVEGIRFIVCCNTRGRGDDSGAYINTQVQSVADLERFNGFVEMDYISDTQEQAMLERMFPDVAKGVIEKMVAIAKASRDKYRNKAIGRVLSTGSLINWVDNYRLFFTAHHSARISFLGGFDDSSRVAIRELINNKFGQEDSEVLSDARAAARASDKADDEG